jgi:pilus assembly protein CpaB
MRIGSILVFVLALALAVVAGVLSMNWLEQQRKLAQPAPAQPQQRISTKVVIAAAPMRFGAELSPANLKEVEWPSSAVPAGAFTSSAELLKSGDRRIVLSAIEQNEPILKWKITGPGQRASLSALIDKDKKAVTIRVNDVLGVAGFVLPGDRVDIMLTRQHEVDDSRNKKKTFNDVVLQNIRVLGVDQLADDRTEKPSVVKAVTVEVSQTDAQRLALASSVGTLSLALRAAGDTASIAPRRVGVEDLGGEFEVAEVRPAVEVAAPQPQVVQAPPKPSNATIGVVRAASQAEYVVPVEKPVR